MMDLRLVRFTYWAGAIIDILAGIQLLVPDNVTILGLPGMRAAGLAGMPAIVAAVLMFGFAAILIWAQYRPVERRALLFVTLAVIVALASANVVSGVQGWQVWGTLVPPLLVQTVLTALFTISFVITGRAATRSDPSA